MRIKLTASQKRMVIAGLHSGLTITDLAEWFNCSKATIITVINRSEPWRSLPVLMVAR